MMELRWIIDPRQDWQRKLQYRTLGTTVEWHGKAGGIRRQEWSEWQDVPEVSGSQPQQEGS